jgi:hypothetical protein
MRSIILALLFCTSAVAVAQGEHLHHLSREARELSSLLAYFPAPGASYGGVGRDKRLHAFIGEKSQTRCTNAQVHTTTQCTI